MSHNNHAIQVETARLAKRVARDHQLCLRASYNFNRKGSIKQRLKNSSSCQICFLPGGRTKNPGDEPEVFTAFTKSTETRSCVSAPQACGSLPQAWVVCGLRVRGFSLPCAMGWRLTRRAPMFVFMPRHCGGRAAPGHLTHRADLEFRIIGY